MRGFEGKFIAAGGQRGRFFAARRCRAGAAERRKLERLCRYIARPAVADGASVADKPR
mgnify:CR=1 FL=1